MLATPTAVAKKRTLLNHPWLAALAGGLLNAYGEVFRLSSRIRFEVHPDLDRLVRQQGVGVIYALWHCQAFFVPLLRGYDRRRVAMLLSSHRDGQIVAVAVRLRGMAVVAGSSTRGGLKAYRELRRCLERRQPVCITPDGPRGPAEQVKSGVIHLSQQSGCPIVPVSIVCSRVHRLRSWDRTILPLPFSRVVLHLGEPFYPPVAMEEARVLLAVRLQQVPGQACDGSR